MSARRLLEAYDPALRSKLRIDPALADDPAAVDDVVRALPPAAMDLLDQILLVTPPGDVVPDRLRERIQRDGDALWWAGLLLPRASVSPGATIQPQHYAGSCKLNPALRGRLPFADLGTVEARATFPPSDAGWDAIVVAATLEAAPGALTQDGTLRRDVERRLYASLGDEADADGRWSLALRMARLSQLVRVSTGRLVGAPEAIARPITDPTALCPDAATAAVAATLLRIVREDWRAYDALQTRVDPATIGVGAEGWAALFQRAVDVLHRAAIFDVSEEGGRPVAVRKAAPRPNLPGGFVLTSDGEILVHVGELRSEAYGRLCRLAPFVEGGALRRHRLRPEGAAADVASGHTDTAGFLAAHSRTGVPAHVRDLLDGWQRSATRITVLTGVDILEHADGRFSVATAVPMGARVWDANQHGRGRFLVDREELVVPASVDALPVRAALAQVAREVHHDETCRRFRLDVRAWPHPDRVIHRLQTFYGGELPGEIESRIWAGSAIEPVSARPAVIVRLPMRAAAALRRDRVLGTMPWRALSHEELVVEAEDLPRIEARLAALGFAGIVESAKPAADDSDRS